MGFSNYISVIRDIRFQLFLLGHTLCEEFFLTKSRPVPVGPCFQLVKIVVGDNEDDDVDRGTILQLFNAFSLHGATRGIARKNSSGRNPYEGQCCALIREKQKDCQTD